jgi:hypothetical protein
VPEMQGEVHGAIRGNSPGCFVLYK